MNDLNGLLERAAGPHDPHALARVPADLTRGRRALARSRTRRAAAGLVGVAAAAALGVGLTRGHEAGDASVATAPTGVPDTLPTPPAPEGYDEPGLSFAAPPEGWEVQGITASYVTFGQPGDDPNPQIVGSKIHVSLELNDPFGEARQIDGRTFWVDDAVVNPHHTTVMTMSPDHPRVLIRAQFGRHRWDVASALAFVAGIQVLDSAQPAVG